MTDGDSKQLMQDLIEYLVKISQHSYNLIRERFTPVFDAIDEQCLPGQPQQQIQEEDENDRGIDVMGSDDEDEEDIESEMEEDRVFLNDDLHE